MPNSSSSDLITKLNAARQELFDLGGRNPLINFRPQKTRGLSFDHFNPQEIIDTLLSTNGRVYLRGENAFENPSQPSLAQESDLELFTDYREGELHRRLEHTYYTARTIREEQGINVLYFALGVLEWRPADQNETSRAPLILIPVTMQRTTILDRFSTTYTGDELEPNHSLRLKLEQDFGVLLPFFPDEETLNLAQYFAAVKNAIEDQPEWVVRPRDVVLGFFSFTRLMLYNDLDSSLWPADQQPADHSVLSRLLGDSGSIKTDPPSTIYPLLDEQLDYRQSHLVFDADSTQVEAINAVANGESLVIQGPPGTGKSQTIANIIAQAIGRGQTVLFVAEKMAALEVVRQRLSNIGLDPAVLELHNHNSSRAAIIDELRRTLTLGEPKEDGRFGDLEELVTLRKSLNDHSRAMNEPIGSSGLSPYEIFGRLLQTNAQETTESISTAAFWDAAQVDEVEEMLGHLDQWLGKNGAAALHPLQASRVTAASQEQIIVFGEQSAAAAASLETYLQASRTVFNQLGVALSVTLAQLEETLRFAERLADAPYLIGLKVADRRWVDEEETITEALAAGEQIASLRRRYEHVLIPAAWDQQVLPIRGALMTARKRFFGRFSSAAREAERLLAGLCQGSPPQAIDDRIELVDAVLTVQRLRGRVKDAAPLLADLFGDQWAGWESDWGELNQAGLWLMTVHQAVEEGTLSADLLPYLEEGLTYDQRAALDSPLREATQTQKKFNRQYKRFCELSRLDPLSWQLLPTADVAHRLGRCAEEPSLLLDIVALNQLDKQLQGAGLVQAREWLAEWRLGQPSLLKRFTSGRLIALLERARLERPLLTTFDQAAHEAAIDRFRELDIGWLRHNRRRLAYIHWDNLPPQGQFGRLGTLWNEINKKRGHRPLRELIVAAGSAVQQIKPVFMMSPLSVAKVIPPGTLSFDLVIFDEASQVRPVDAFGAILRGRQAVIVGDSRQLPPTTFFEKMVETKSNGPDHLEHIDDSWDTTAPVPESILDLFVNSHTPQKMLRWHYRSRHESLIGLSNRDFYDGRLVLFPSPDHGKQDVGLHLHHDPTTIYDRGGTRINQREAAAVAQAVVEHARRFPHLTLGVATFSQPQRAAIDQAIQRLRYENPQLNQFIDQHEHEPFFVKNLENVQGDERDVMLISIGYGRDQNGRLVLNFGPLNGEGGERRLNVLITRARHRCEIFSNVQAEDIDLKRTGSIGVRSLKRYLAYAETGQLADYGGYGRSQDDPFTRVIMEAMERVGFDLAQRVGLGGIEVDLAVRDAANPERFTVGIELDGRDYARASSATERDRLQQAVLTRLGWQIERVWAAAWFGDPQQAAEDLKSKVGRAHKHRVAAAEKLLSPSQEEIPRYAGRPKKPELILDYPYVPHATRYSLIDGDAWDTVDRVLREDIIRESPLSASEVDRRMRLLLPDEKEGTWVFGTGIGSFFEKIAHDPDIQKRGDFYWHTSMKEAPVRRRSRCPLVLRRWELIAREEQAAAVQLIVKQSMGITPTDLVDALIETLGLLQKQKGAIFPRIRDLLSGMIRSGEISYQGGHLLPAETLPHYLRGRENVEKREKVALAFWHEMVPARAKAKSSNLNKVPAELTSLVVPYEEAPEPYDLSKFEGWQLHGPTKAYHSGFAYWFDLDSKTFSPHASFRPQDFNPQLLTKKLWESWPNYLSEGELCATLQFSIERLTFEVNQLFFVERKTAACYRLVQIWGEPGYYLVTKVNQFYKSVGQYQKNQTLELLPFNPVSGEISPQERVIYRTTRNFYTHPLDNGIFPPENSAGRTAEVSEKIRQPLIQHISCYAALIVKKESPLSVIRLKDRIMNAPSLRVIRFNDRRPFHDLGVKQGVESGLLVEKNGFFFYKDAPVVVRNRSQLYKPHRTLEMVSDEEILQTLALIRQTSPNLPLKRMPAQVVRILGVTQNSRARRERILNLAHGHRSPVDSETMIEVQSEQNPLDRLVIPYPTADAIVPLNQRRGWQLINSEFISECLISFDWQTRTFGSPLEIGLDDLSVHYTRPASVRPGRLAGRLRYRPSQGVFILHDLYFIIDQSEKLDTPLPAYRLLLTDQKERLKWVTHIVHPTSYRHRSGKMKAVGTVRGLDFDPQIRQFSGREKNISVEQGRRNRQTFPGDDVVHPKVAFSVSQKLLIEMNASDKAFVLETVHRFGPIQPRLIEVGKGVSIERYQFQAFVKRVLQQLPNIESEDGFYWVDSKTVKVRQRRGLPSDLELYKLENVADIELRLALEYLIRRDPDKPLEDLPRQLFQLMGLRVLTAKRRERLHKLAEQVEKRLKTELD